MQKQCVQCSARFEVTDEDMAFYQRMEVPPPTFCPLCRFRRRCSFMNTRNFYPRACAEDGGVCMSMYPEDSLLQIIHDKIWWSDEIDFLGFGRDYDFSTSFFEQFYQLFNEVPVAHLQREYSSLENSDFCNAISNSKNCYLVMNAEFNEDCMYCFSMSENKNCIDCMHAVKSELCYECVDTETCYSCKYCQHCEGCSDLVFCRDCIGCADCFGCIGLRQKKYHIFNKPHTEEQYKQHIADLKLLGWNSVQEIQKQVSQFFVTQPHKFTHSKSNQDVEGDYIYQSKNTHDSYIVEKVEESKFCDLLRYVTTGTNYAYDYTSFGVEAEFVYDTAWCGLGINNIKFSLWNYGSSDLEYCFGCHYSDHLFGCSGLRHQKYCILNKQYTKEGYEELIPKIKKQMMDIPYKDINGIEYRYGEFFPASFSPFYFNHTWAQDFSPMSREECEKLHYHWCERKDRPDSNILHWSELPNSIEDVEDNILNATILCKAHDEDATKAQDHNCIQHFKITSQELDFYRRLKLPIPRYCHNSRYKQKLGELNPRHLWDRNCQKCQKAIKTSYEPSRPEIVYCEECYLKEVY